jgi:hypothetical protein
MICPAPIDSTPQTAPKTFTNWARAVSFTAARSFRPTTRGEIVKIIRQAEDAGQRVKWTGSVWSFMGVFVSSDLMIESDGITGAIDKALILDRLTLSDTSLRGSLAHIKGGTKVFNVNRILHGLPPALNGGGADETNLRCDPMARALPTLGGSGGQSIAGVMATGSHGGDLHLPPIADCVQAIHLIGPGGQEFWIERSSGLTAGTEADTQAQLQAIVDGDPVAAAEMCNGILVKKDDDLFRAALVSVGRMGFVYALVVKTEPAFKLQEIRTADTWESYRANLGAESFPTFAAKKYFLNILINPFGNAGQHDCKIAERIRVDCETENSAPASGGGGFTDWLCRQQDVGWIAAILIAAIAVLVVAIVGLVEAISIMLAAAAGFLGVPLFGWIIAAGIYAAVAVLVGIIIALGLVIAALVALLGYIIAIGHPTPGQIVAAITNFAFTVGLQDVMRSILVNLFNSVYPLITKTDVSWKIMDTYGYAAEDFCQKVDSIEIAFDVAAATGGGGYLAFVDEVLAIFDDLYNRRIAVATILAIRYTRNTEALIGMSKFPMTCHIEIPIIRDFAGNSEFIERVQRAAIAHNGVPHWGQLMGIYAARNILDLHGADLTLWRQKLTQLIREGGGNRMTMSNSFTATYNLEPFDETPISAVRLTVTVGNDSLGDTDWLRHDVSADFARVTLRSGTFFEVSLNEGTTWPAHTTHVRDVPVAAGTMWGDVASVRIQHFAAGNDWNADNWTMNAIVIASVSDTGDVREEYNRTDTPIWQFRKNDRQIWQQDFI